MNDSFDVYIGNLSVVTTKEQLNELFSQTIPPLQECDLIKTVPEKPNIQALEDIVIRYYKPCKKSTLFKEVHFDISKSKVLNKEENKNYFKILTKK